MKAVYSYRFSSTSVWKMGWVNSKHGAESIRFCLIDKCWEDGMDKLCNNILWFVDRKTKLFS